MNTEPADRPVILVQSDVREVDGYVVHAALDYYVQAVFSGCDALPLIMPSLGDRLDPDLVLAEVDGVLITGARSNVHPRHYGETETDAHGPFDEVRDSTSLPLIRRTIDRGQPLFCICRGLQELNVALGGSLAIEIQERDGGMDHRGPEGTPDQRFAIRHPVHLERTGCLGRIIESDRIDVNSVHRQAIGRLSDRLGVEATADDGTIEAVSVIGATGFALGVQWHPEYWFRTDAASAKLFKAFGDAAREWRARRPPREHRLWPESARAS